MEDNVVERNGADVAAVADVPHTAEGTATGEVEEALVLSKGPTLSQENVTHSPVLPPVAQSKSQSHLHRKHRGLANASLAPIVLSPDTRRLASSQPGASENGSFTGTAGSVGSNRTGVSLQTIHGNGGPNSTVGGTLLRREREVLDLETSFKLGFRRDFRRRDAARGLDKNRQDYVYYNHRSKGCAILHEKPEDTMTVTYNHLFDFGDGSRFLRVKDGPAKPNPSVIDPHTGSFKSLRQSRDMIRAGNQMMSTARCLNTQPAPRREKGLRTVSVDVARSLRVADLRVYAFEKPIVIESIIAGDPSSIAASREGIGSVLNQGKLRWSDVPPDLQQSYREAELRHTASHDCMRSQNISTETKEPESLPRPPSTLSRLCDGIYRPSTSDAQTIGTKPEGTRVRSRPRQRQVRFSAQTDDGAAGPKESRGPPGEAEAGGQASWQRRMETNRTYETSRLHYRRGYEMERAAETAPSSMTFWSTVK